MNELTQTPKWQIDIKDLSGGSIQIEISKDGVFKIISSDRDIPLVELNKLWEMSTVAMSNYKYVQCTKIQ